MPPARSLGPASKKHTLSLAQLASYDDILTDALVDHCYYWTTIPKNRPSYLPSRGIKEEEIARVLQTHLVITPNFEVAEEKLLATNGLSKFYRALKTENEREDFRRHLRRYMQIHLADCPFEVTTTNRYTIFQEEASISARRFIKSNEIIKYLSGIQVVITPEEEAELSERKKDFSIVVSSRKKEVNLFMGPARFANHDCDANARLVTTGQAGIEIIATKPIGVGDEITVTYGDSYFGENNCECLCKTCEDKLRNGWAPPDGFASVKQSIEADTTLSSQGYSLRKRSEQAQHWSHSESPSLTPIPRPIVRKTRTKVTVQSGEPTPTAESASSSSRKRELDALASPPATPAKRRRTRQHLPSPERMSRDVSVTSAINNDGSSSTQSMICTYTASTCSETAPGPSAALPVLSSNLVYGQSEDSIGQMLNVDVPSECATENKPSQSSCKQVEEADQEGMPEPLLLSSDSLLVPVLALPTPESSMDSEGEDQFGSFNDEVAIDATSNLPTPQKGKGRKVRAEGKLVNSTADANADGRSSEDGTENSSSTRHRVPGDYTLTPLLLSEPETAWVFCTVCSKAFVQRDAYFTRMSCPRCERHSKMYGFMWPKTQPEGKWDKEERVLDHRLIHRFLDPEDEAKIRGRKRLTWRSQSKGDEGNSGEVTQSQAATLEKSSPGSGIWRKLKYMREDTGESLTKRMKISRTRAISGGSQTDRLRGRPGKDNAIETVNRR